MNLLNFILLGILSISTVTEAARLRPKNGRGTRQNLSKNVGYNRRRSSPEYLKRSDLSSTSTCNGCVTASSAEITAPKKNIWHGLTNEEAGDVAQFLFKSAEFKLVPTQNATEWNNTLMLVELLLPNKTDALFYTDGTGSAPVRWAHAVLDIRAVDEPYMQDYVVGPLPLVEGATTVSPLNYPYNKGIGKTRNYNADEDGRARFMTAIGSKLSDITMGLWGKELHGHRNDTLAIWGIDPLWQEDERIIDWQQFWGIPTSDFDSATLLPMGLYIKVDVTGRDPEGWEVKGVLYNDIFYNTIDEFRTAYYTVGFVKNGANEDGTWAHTDQDGQTMKGDEHYPPQQIAPDGGRFGVDIENKYVEWMDFSFYIGFSRDTGARLFDIKYKGERIIYELGLMEALAHYAGNDPVQSGTAYLDSYYSFAKYVFELLPGFDCPTYSTYLNTSYYVEETHKVHPNSMCIFETDAGYPLSRHSSSGYAASTKNIFLTVRTISTVGNYDYMFDYTFYGDGSVGVDVRASGYIQSAYFAHNEEYGFKIHDNLSGSSHQHVLNYKIDLDILGTANSIATTEFVPATEKYSWSGGKKRKTFKLKKSWIDNEDDGKINWDVNNAKVYTVVNKEEKNKYGEYRGYKVVPSTPGVHASAIESSNLNDAAQWSHHHLYITKRKDTEPSSAHALNSLDTKNPIVNFAKFFDHESLDQEDVVLWANLGMHHAPSTGDVPNTVFTQAHAGLMITPVNYLLGSPAKQTRHMARVSFTEDGVKEVKKFGVVAPSCDISAASLEADLSTYMGDQTIRKFPYDFRGWYEENAN